MSEHPAAKRHRAYAQAVDEAFAQRGYLDGHKDGYAAGLSAARDAVERAYEKDSPTVQHGTVPGVAVALAAIDALRGESNE